MNYTLTIRQEHYDELRTHVLSAAPLEGAAYLLCGESRTNTEHRFLVRAIIPVADEDYLVRERFRLSIRSQSFAAIAKEAILTKASILFVHSHPGGAGTHSGQDDREEPDLMRFFASRVENRLHGSMVVGDVPELSGRVWVNGSWRELSRVRIMGDRFRIIDPRPATEDIPTFFDRQVRAFGPDVQKLLRHLHVGVVGVGGTGSAVVEQLARLGVGKISMFDGDSLEDTNVTRVYGSSVRDEGRNKALILRDDVERMGLGTDAQAFPHHITIESIAEELRNCHIIFGCTDKERPRGILVRLALYYLIPVFDVGVKIDAPDEVIRSIDGRLTILWPGEACLFCLGRISSEIIALESKPREEQESLRQEGYAPQLNTADPAIITFTTSVAAKAVTELLHRLTGFMGDVSPYEFRVLFHEDTIRGTSHIDPASDCLCAKTELWGRGDRRSFLDLVWLEARPVEATVSDPEMASAGL